VALDLQPESLPCAIEARYAGEGDAAIPADRLLVEQGGGPVVLFLRPGEYRIAAVSLSERNRTQDWTALNQLLSRVETTRLGPSESRTVTLELIR